MKKLVLMYLGITLIFFFVLAICGMCSQKAKDKGK